MASTELKSFKPIKPNQNPKTNFWFNLGIEDNKTARTDAVHEGFKPFALFNQIIIINILCFLMKA